MTILYWVLLVLGPGAALLIVALLVLLQVTDNFDRWKPRRGVCRICGCTDRDCRACIARTGEPCAWIDEAHTLCSRCVDYLEAGDLVSGESGVLLSPDCSPLNSVKARGSHGA